MKFFSFLFKVFFLLLLLLIGVAVFLFFQYKPLIDSFRDPNSFFAASKDQTVRQMEGLPPEAQAYKEQAKQELRKMEGMPGGLAYAQSQINRARSKLSEAQAKLAGANPTDPQKAQQVAKARQLIPKANQLLDQAESTLRTLANLQEQANEWLHLIRSKF